MTEAHAQEDKNIQEGVLLCVFASGNFWFFESAQFCLTDCDETFPPVFMPKYNVGTFRTMLQSNYGYKKRRDFYMCLVRRSSIA